MGYLHEYQKELFSIATIIFAAIYRKLGKAKFRLLWAIPANFSHQVAAPPAVEQNGMPNLPSILVHTRTVAVRNDGKEPLTNVEVLLNSAPGNINLWPPRRFEKQIRDPDQRCTLIFDSLAPGEWVDIQLLLVDNGPLHVGMPEVVSVKSRETMATRVEVRAFVVLPRWRARTNIVLITAGVGGVVYVSLWLLKWLLG